MSDLSGSICMYLCALEHNWFIESRAEEKKIKRVRALLGVIMQSLRGCG